MAKHFEFTGDERVFEGVTVHRIRALVDLPELDVVAGDVGGWVEMLEALRPLLVDGAAVVVERHRDSPHTEGPAGYTPTPQKLKKRTIGIARMDMAVFSADDGGEE